MAIGIYSLDLEKNGGHQFSIEIEVSIPCESILDFYERLYQAVRQALPKDVSFSDITACNGFVLKRVVGEIENVIQ